MATQVETPASPTASRLRDLANAVSEIARVDLGEPTYSPAVLLVDDQLPNLLALEVLLGEMGLRLVRASSGFEALRCLLNEHFALILLDVHMPEMDGFETASLIRGRARTKQTPIIFLTAVETAKEQVFKGYSSGAVDYLLKPIVPEVLRSKVAVFANIDVQRRQIERQAEQLRLLEHREHERKLAEAERMWEAKRLAEEIRIARQIQQRLFPAAPLPIPGFDIAGASFPAEATGGDYFDYIPMHDGDLALVIGDVSGHGFGPALLMAELRAYLRAFLLTRTDVGEIIQLVNCALAADTPEDRFATLFIAKLHPGSRSFSFAGAGHLPGYVFNRDGEVIHELASSGLPLAVLSNSTYIAEQGPTLESGEMLVLLTDGMLEAWGCEEEPFGQDRVLALLREHRHLPARQMLNVLYDQVRGFCGPAAQLDDMTAIIVKAEG